MTREGVPLIVIQLEPGHSNLGVTSTDLQGIDNAGSEHRGADLDRFSRRLAGVEEEIHV